MCFNNLPITSTTLLTLCPSGTNSLWFTTYLSKNVIKMILNLDFPKRKFLALVMTLRFISCSDVSSLGHIEIPMTHIQLQSKLGNWDDLDKTGWSLGVMCLRCFCSSVSLCGTNFAHVFVFRKSSWRSWGIISLLTFDSFDIIPRVNRRCLITVSLTFAIVFAFP
jgi:hypothetical protein